MKKGRLIAFYLPFFENGNYLSSEEQAQRILNEARKQLLLGYTGVAITYSANYDQSVQIEHTYLNGGYLTGTNGANQASVMHSMEHLLSSNYTDLQGKLQIAPIVTMTYSDYGENTHREVIKHNLDSIKHLIEKGWLVLGWQNQSSSPDFAVGGGIASLSTELNDYIQSTLKQFEKGE